MFQTEGIDHIAIAVRDVRASVIWYQDVLGLERLHEDQWGDFPAVVGKAATAIALFPVAGEPKPRPGPETIAMRHIAFRLDRPNFESAKRDFSERGITFTEQHHGISDSFYFVDPDGHQIEFTTYDL